jgi:hypothetical protein
MAGRRPRNPVAHALRSGDGPYRKRVVLMKVRYKRKPKHVKPEEVK